MERSRQSPKAHALVYNYVAAIGGNFRIRFLRMRHPLTSSVLLSKSNNYAEHGNHVYVEKRYCHHIHLSERQMKKAANSGLITVVNDVNHG